MMGILLAYIKGAGECRVCGVSMNLLGTGRQPERSNENKIEAINNFGNLFLPF